jgi:flagellar protein FliS
MSVDLYRTTAVTTAHPEDQVSLLFDGWQVALYEAECAIEAGNVPDAHNALIRGQNLAAFLWALVNPESPVARETQNVLAFLHQEQVRANVEKSKERVAGVRQVVEALAAAWEASRKGAKA